MSDIEISAEFEKWVQSYVDIDNTIKEATKDLKALRQTQTDLDTKIKDYMKKSGIEGMNITGGKLKIAVSNRKTTLNKTSIAKALENCGELRDIKKAEEIANFIYNSRETIETEKLKRTVNK